MKYLFAALLFVILIGLSCVSAADISQTTDITAENNDLESDNVVNDKTGSDADYVGEDEKTDNNFTTLAYQIAEASEVLNLTGDYSFYDSDADYRDGIIINKSLTINGNGCTIDGKNKAGILFIENCTVTLNNICFINGYADFGAAIHTENSNLTINNCNFTNNHAAGEEDEGGAIYFDGNALTINNNIFKNNTAVFNSGALEFRGEYLTVNNTKFISNKAENYIAGISVNTADDVKIINSEFIGNSAHDYVALELCAGNTLIDNCIFENNTSIEEIIIIILYSNTTVINSIFKGNNANDSEVITSANRDLIIDRCHFIDNACGAVNLYSGYGEISNSKFINTTSGKGYSIHINPESELYLSNNTINNVSSEIFNNGGKILSPCSAIIETGTSFVIGDNTTIAAVITDDNKNLIEDAYPVYINVDGAGIESKFNSNTGRYEIEYTFNTLGIRNVNVSSANFSNLNSAGVNITVVKNTASITAEAAGYIINYGGKYSVTVIDVSGKPAVGEKVTFTLNGKNIAASTTNNKGVATVTITAKMLKTAKTGKRNLMISVGSGKYNSASKTVKITINKEKTKIIAAKKTFKRRLKTKKYQVTLKNSKGKAVSNVKVTLNVKGKKYTAKTNAKGKAVFKINKLNKKGIFKATIKYAGSSLYNASGKKVNIICR